MALLISVASFALAGVASAEEITQASPKDGAASNSAEQGAAPKREAFTTGVAKGRDLLDTAISASTLSEAEIQKIGTRSIAEVLSNIPGIRSETGGTDGMTAITIRGLPLSGDGSKFLQIQEDGLPVVEFGDIHFAPTTMFLRTDLSLSQVQAIRGGSASTFASNSPGGIVNFISKTGEETGGTFQLSSGIDHELGRADFSYGGRLSSSLRFNIGGYYRQGEGPRATGYDAFKGGQIKLNVTKEFDHGFVRIYAKLLDDREPGYGLVPIRVTGSNAKPSYAPLPSFDPRRDTMSSRYINSFLALDQNNNPHTLDAHEGNRAKVRSIGFEAQFDVADWTLSNRLRYAEVSGSYNENLPAITLPASVLPIAFGAGPGTTARFASGPNSGQSIGDPATLNGNGLLARGLYINSKLNSLDNVTNDFRASRVWNAGAGKITTTAGLYASSQDLNMMWTFLSPITDIASGGNSHLIDLFAPNGASITQDGMLFYSLQLGPSSYHQYYDVNYRTVAPYGSVNYQLGRLSIGGSLRYDFGKVSGAVYGGDLGGGRTSITPTDLNRDGVISERFTASLPLSRPGPVAYNYGYASYSVGANYRISDPISVFGRYSRGGRASSDRVLFPPR
ncbi:TonB-dependent receptor domain-containing protein [Caulobacter sp. BP25]|uniref:TonB-dependent receptor domain-containing protein n=1 Tax=Caulobacter sp. BP25 TaxID=2048900 RepID=UPI002100BEF0|nr:TonB-dependent receptor [Caulobacter sp. BP25]